MEDTIDSLIKDWRETHPIDLGPINDEEREKLQRRLMFLLGPDTQLLVDHYTTENSHKIKKFISEEVTSILKAMGRNETTIFRDILTNLTIHESQDEIMKLAYEELGDS